MCPDHDISIHVPREGHDETVPEAEPFDFVFLSTCPVRGTTTALALGAGDRGISIHVPREGHDGRARYRNHSGKGISIHVPREGHDRPFSFRFSSWKYFYPRAP